MLNSISAIHIVLTWLNFQKLQTAATHHSTEYLSNNLNYNEANHKIVNVPDLRLLLKLPLLICLIPYDYEEEILFLNS